MEMLGVLYESTMDLSSLPVLGHPCACTCALCLCFCYLPEQKAKKIWSRGRLLRSGIRESVKKKGQIRLASRSYPIHQFLGPWPAEQRTRGDGRANARQAIIIRGCLGFSFTAIFVLFFWGSTIYQIYYCDYDCYQVRLGTTLP
jgi:hypothetical protein